jgi:O-antigen/teichoic acid export membrane protein
LIAPKFWIGLEIVPVILLAYVFLGIYNNLIAGIYIEKRTALLPVVTFAAAAMNVAANYLLIPPWGLMGAALATLVSYVLMAILLYVLVRRIYPVPYEWARLGKIAVAAIVVIAGGFLAQHTGFTLGLKTLVLVMFPVLLYVFRFYVPGEMKVLSGLAAGIGFGKPRQDSPYEPK